MAWIPAVWGAELLIGTVISRCAVNRAVDVADQVTGVLFRMAGLGLGPYPDKNSASTDDRIGADLWPAIAESSQITCHFQEIDKHNHNNPKSILLMNVSTANLLAELRSLNTYNRVRFIHAVLQDAIREFAPKNRAQSIVDVGASCDCGSILCASSTLQEALRQLEEKFLAILSQLISISDSIEHRKMQWWWSKLASRCPYSDQVRILALMLPEAEKNVQQLFASIPWIQITTSKSRV